MWILLVAVVAVFIPFPAFQHFIWPLSWCLLADICNHTWIPECGSENVSYEKRHRNNTTSTEYYMDYKLFIDDCDLYEYNCDKNRSYEIDNYTSCFLGPVTCPEKLLFLRVGNYKYLPKARHVIYDPTPPALRTNAPRTERPIRGPVVPRHGMTPPNLPARMRSGKRRYKAEEEGRRLRLLHMGLITTTARTTTRSKRTFRRRTSETTHTYVLSRITVIKNGIKMVKLVKSVGRRTPAITPKTVSEDSDFLA